MTTDEIKKSIVEAATPDAKAAAIETMLWDYGRSPENVIYCFIMADRLDRVRFEDVCAGAPDPEKLDKSQLRYGNETLTWQMVDGNPQYLLQGVPIEDVEAYEDTMLGTGQMLSAMCFKYLATLDPQALARAHTLLEGMHAVYELGLEEEPGWLPKPYGFKNSGQSSMDNQCPYYVGLLRYFRIAPPEDKEKILRILKDEMGYWMRHKYAMHRDYFGLMVDYKTEKYYPGHWVLAYLPLCHALWQITGEKIYETEYQWLLERLDIDKGEDPEYLRTEVRCLHRWYYQYGALLEFGAEPRDTWLRGLKYQVACMREETNLYSDGLYDVWHHAWIWLEPHNDEDRNLAFERLMAQDVDTFRYKWPGGKNTYSPCLDFRENAMYCFKNTNWLEMFWKGRLRGDW